MIVKAQNKFQVFNDLDGNPLNNGYVYMGTAGSNPETNPITVYSDSALTIPVAQPLRTIGGHIVVNGSRINVYTDGDYSITSRESDGSLIYSSLSGNIDAVQESAIQALADVETASTTGVAAVESAQSTAEASVQTIVDSISAQESAITANTTELASITSGTTTPTITAVTNVTATYTYTDGIMYSRNGSVVTISGVLYIQPTAIGLATVSVPLPIASNFTLAQDAIGAVSIDSSSETDTGYIKADATTDTIYVYVRASTTNGRDFRFNAQYVIK